MTDPHERMPRRSRPGVETAAVVVALLAFATAAGVAVAGQLGIAIAITNLALLAVVAAVVAYARRSAARRDLLARELQVQRLALANVARDTTATARSARRLEQSMRRGVAASLGMEGARVPEGAAPDGLMIAAMVVLGSSRELHYVGELDGYERHRLAWQAVDPGIELGHLRPDDATAYLDRRAERARSGQSSFPTFVVDEPATLRRVISGDLAQLVTAVLRVPDFLVVIPRRLRASALEHDPGATVQSVGDAVLLVRPAPSPSVPE